MFLGAGQQLQPLSLYERQMLAGTLREYQQHKAPGGALRRPAVGCVLHLGLMHMPLCFDSQLMKAAVTSVRWPLHLVHSALLLVQM